MQIAGSSEHASRSPGHAAFTLAEILIAAAISTTILLMILALLGSATDALSAGRRHGEVFTEGRAALERVARDLGCCMAGRYRNTATSREASQTASASTGGSDPCPRWQPIPFEHNRTAGTVFDHRDGSEAATLERAVMNSAATASGSLHPNFDTLAFATRSLLGYHADPGIKLVCYYCALTRDSPFGGSRASMKLFRHVRADDGMQGSCSSYHEPTPIHRHQARAGTVLSALAATSRPQLERGIRDNRHLPYLLMPVDAYLDPEKSPCQAMHAWPANFISLPEPPPGSNDTTDTDTYHLPDLQLRPDDPLAFNVLRFKATPMRRGADGRYLAATRLNAAHRINRDHPSEWPVILAPDVVEIELRIIGDETAAKFPHPEDWLNWQDDPTLAALVQRESQTFRMRIAIGQAGS